LLPGAKQRLKRLKLPTLRFFETLSLGFRLIFTEITKPTAQKKTRRTEECASRKEDEELEK
jgi:hypothetical protein